MPPRGFRRFSVLRRAYVRSRELLERASAEVVIAAVCALAAAAWQGTHEAETPTHLLRSVSLGALIVAGLVGAVGGLLLVRGGAFLWALVAYRLSGRRDRVWVAQPPEATDDLMFSDRHLQGAMVRHHQTRQALRGHAASIHGERRRPSNGPRRSGLEVERRCWAASAASVGCRVVGHDHLASTRRRWTTFAPHGLRISVEVEKVGESWVRPDWILSSERNPLIFGEFGRTKLGRSKAEQRLYVVEGCVL
jgi:hypothetical protein